MCVYTDASDEWLLGCYKYDYGIRTDASVSAWLSHHSLGLCITISWYCGTLDSQSQAIGGLLLQR